MKTAIGSRWGQVCAVLAMIAAWGAASAQSPPANDDYTGAVLMEGASGSLVGDNTGATARSNDWQLVLAGYRLGTGTVWYRYVVPEAGQLSLSACGGVFEPSILGFTLERAAAGSYGYPNKGYQPGCPGALRVNVIAGEELYFSIGDLSAAPSTNEFTLQWTLTPAPANDHFADAALITGDGGVFESTFTASSVEPDETSYGSRSYNGSSLWWRWTAPRSGNFQIDSCGSALEPHLSVSTGATLAAQATVAVGGATAPACESGNRQAVFPAVEGEQYHIRLAAPWFSTGLARVGLAPAPAAANDDPDSATTISGEDGSFQGTFIGATQSSLERIDGADGPGVWYRWSSPVDGTFLFSSCGTDFDNLLQAFTIDDAGLPADPLERTATTDCRTGSVGDSFVFGAEIGRDYLLLLNARDETAYGITRLGWIPTPVGDRFADPRQITGTAGESRFDATAATFEPGEPLDSDAGQGSVWWRFTPPVGGRYDLTLCGTSYDARLAIYTGSELGSLTTFGTVTQQLCQGSREGKQTLRLQLRSDTEYVIRAAGVELPNGAERRSGEVVFNWEYIPNVVNDLPSGAIELTDDFGSLTANLSLATHDVELESPRGAQGPGIWYRWTATDNREATFFLLNQQFSAIVAAYRSEFGVPSDLVAISDYDRGEIDGDAAARGARFTPTAGETYLILVVATDPETPTSDFSVRWWVRPMNDDFANATPISGEAGNAEWTMNGATVEPGEPISDDRIVRTVWFRWTAPATGLMRWRWGPNSPGAPDFFAADEAVEPTDLEPIQPVATAGALPGDDYLLVEEGREYAIRLSGFASLNLSAIMTLNWQRIVTSNDNLADAIAVGPETASVEGTTNGATLEPNERTPQSIVGGSVWYSWTAPASGTWAFSGISAPCCTFLSVFKRDGEGGLHHLGTTRLSGSQYLPDYRLQINTSADETLLLQVTKQDSQSSAEVSSASFRLSWNAVVPKWSPNALYSTAAELNGPSGRFNTLSLVPGVEHLSTDNGLVIPRTWYRWTPERDGYVTFIACGASAYAPTEEDRLRVLVGPDTLTAIPPSVLRGSSQCTGSSALNTSPSVTFFAEAGTEYHFGIPTVYGFLEWFSPEVPNVHQLPNEWHFAEGAATEDLKTYYVVANPGSQPVEITMTIMPENGGRFTVPFSLAPAGRITWELNAILAERGLSGGAAVSLVGSNGLGFAAERAVYTIDPTTGSFHGGHAATGSPEMRNEWIMPEGSAGQAGQDGPPFQTFILVANPGNEAINVALEYRPDNGGLVTSNVTVGAGRRVTIEPAKAGLGLPARGFMTIARSSSPFIAERVTWWTYETPRGLRFADGTASGPAPIPSAVQYYSTLGLFDDEEGFLLVGNAASRPSTFDLTSPWDSRSTLTGPITVAPLSRRTLNLRYGSELDPLNVFSILELARLDSDAPLSTERVVYTRQGESQAFVSGASSHGATTMATRWIAPNGYRLRVPGVLSSSQVLWIANPNSENARLWIRIVGENGAEDLRTYTLQAKLSRSYGYPSYPDYTDRIGRQGHYFDVSSNLPIVVEQSTWLYGSDPQNPTGRLTGAAIPVLPATDVEPATPLAEGPASATTTVETLLPTPTVTPTPAPISIP